MHCGQQQRLAAVACCCEQPLALGGANEGSLHLPHTALCSSLALAREALCSASQLLNEGSRQEAAAASGEGEGSKAHWQSCSLLLLQHWQGSLLWRWHWQLHGAGASTGWPGAGCALPHLPLRKHGSDQHALQQLSAHTQSSWAAAL
jgi:hypothetical protein